ncbi:hypothetical protein QM716_11825 [Rhodococcus sp. IEGM 1409]|uniref:hypothetical protein n=1 Tax=Rhodococcus TaxID=1827 RepID=UPI0006CF928F|nr:MULTISPECIES: hypothetical protein [Rhodococcus]MDI9900541.1 hypothetical protein [Rhodococcus sp. IEGM 1409]MDV6275386.1 hypothetical protein [Rhodococcus erythropolis]UGQ52906.1 hypothetical protein LRL17_04005 [Rhodococcus qingshengii]
MSGIDFQIDHDGINEILNSPEVRALTDAAAVEIAAAARQVAGDGILIEADPYTTDRPVSSVAIKEISGVARQLKYGTLTKAAGMVGLTVRGR